MKTRQARKKSAAPKEYVWSRSGLTIVVCAVPPSTDYAVVIQDWDGGLLVKSGSLAACIDQFQNLTRMLGAALDRTAQASMDTRAGQGQAKTFDDVIQAMLCHPNGRKVLCRPTRPCRACREK